MYVIVHDNVHDINIVTWAYSILFLLYIFIHESEHATM